MKSPANPLLLLVVLASASACTEQGVAARRGSWEVDYRATWSMKDRRKVWEHLLYRHQGAERALVARHVRGYDFYPDDCIIFHATGPEPGGYFAACGARRPLRLSGPDDGWTKLGDKMELLESKGGEVVVKEQRSVEDILKQAKLQPVDLH
jgi:hypothetical protein